MVMVDYRIARSTAGGGELPSAVGYGGEGGGKAPHTGSDSERPGRSATPYVRNSLGQRFPVCVGFTTRIT